MMATVDSAREGGADYLQFGKRSDSKLTRTEKDEVQILFGNIEHVRNAEKYCMENKNWKANYETIVVAFDEKDMAILDRLSGSEKNQMYKNIALDYIKHRTSGYSLENEIIAYSEAHEPKIKFENGKIRKSHLHIQISYLNAMNDTRIRTTYFNNAFMSDVMDKWVAKKNGLTYIEKIDPNRKKPKLIQKAIDENQTISFRKKLIKDFEKVNSKEQFEKYCEKNNLKIDFVKTYNKKGKEKNHYIKVTKNDNSSLNLRQFEFNKIKEFYGIKPSKSKQKMIDEINSKSKEELGAILGDYYKDRIKMIDSRRSKSHRANLEKVIDKNINNETVKSIKNLSFQEKLFYKTYQKDIKDFDFKGYYIDSKEDFTKFTNNQKQIKIEDKGNEITSTSKGDSLNEEVVLMIKIAEAKGWKLTELEIDGNDEFVAEAEKQIAQRIEELNKLNKKEISKIPDFQKERPNSEIQNYKKDFTEKQYQKKVNSSDFDKIKSDLNSKVVLDYMVAKYKLDSSKYKLTDNNKIDYLNNNQKAKNVLDFVQKEANLTTSEAMDICEELYKKDENRNTHSKGVEKESEVKVEREQKELSNEDLVNNSKVLKKNRRLETIREYNFHLVQTNKISFEKYKKGVDSLKIQVERNWDKFIPIKKEEEVKHHSNKNKYR
jgi:hypothetical protein